MKKYTNLDKFTLSFSWIWLEQLNEKASMLERSENKYIFTLTDLYDSLERLNEEFEILDIKDKRAFTYETIYFDDEDHVSYKHHHQGKRQRFKVRTRRYVDSDLYFFEVKLKDKWNSTVKKRYVCKSEDHWKITRDSSAFINNFYSKLYKKDFYYNLKSSTKMSYKRVTLVAKAGMERLTIDYDLTFYSDDWSVEYVVPKDFIIIETKSSNWNGIADKIFKEFKHRWTSCSKFCLSKIVLWKVDKINSFLPLLKKHFPDILKKKKRQNCLI